MGDSFPSQARSLPAAFSGGAVIGALGGLIGLGGAGWAIRLCSESLYRVIAVLLVMIAVVLLLGHNATVRAPLFGGTLLAVIGVFAGFAIGVVASLLGVAGGELLIPTLGCCCSGWTSNLPEVCRSR